MLVSDLSQENPTVSSEGDIHPFTWENKNNLKKLKTTKHHTNAKKQQCCKASCSYEVTQKNKDHLKAEGAHL